MRIIKVELNKLDKTVLNIGWEGEQNHVQVQIQCGAFFAKYPNAGAGLTVLSPSNVTYPVVLDKEGNDLIWDIDASDVMTAGSGKIQLTFTDGTGDDAEVIKTVIGSFNVNASLAVDGTAPDPIANWIDEANATLAEFENEIEDIDKITEATAADEGKALTAKTVTGGKVTEWEYVDVADPDVIEAAVDDWLDDHPEATTTVQDGSITEAKLHEDLSAELARVDGYYAEMTVGDAEQLVATHYIEDKVPYKFRTSGGSADIGNREYPQKIVGGSMAWNQILQNGNFANATGWTGNGTLSVSNNKATTTGTTTSYINVRRSTPENAKKDHIYLLSADVSNSGGIVQFVPTDTASQGNALFENLTQEKNISYLWKPSADFSTARYVIRFNVTTSGTSEEITATVRNYCVFDLTEMFGKTVADSVYAMEQATAGSGVAWFRSLFQDSYYAYNAGELIHVSGLGSHDMVGFNAWDEQLTFGGTYPMATNKIPVLPSTQYYVCSPNNIYFRYFDSNRTEIGNSTWGKNVVITTPANAVYMDFLLDPAYGSTYKNDICINLSWSGWRNGEYEPYEKHSYPLDSDLTLRGIPKIDASGHLYYDGDEYLPDGSVNRKYGIVDLGTLNYTKYDVAQGTLFRGSISGVKTLSGVAMPNMICSMYPVTDSSRRENKTVSQATGLAAVDVIDNDYSDAATFKTAMSGVYLVYELATPTTESADPYNPIQWVDDFGTEEFVSNTIVPVGHETNYPANLRDKIQHLPDLADTDGKYVITQSDKQMSLTPVENELPTLPSEDGTYTLKVTVSGSTKTLSWVADT